MDIKRNNNIKIEGGMSSMTDLVFLMLIFFIIMSTMSRQTLPVDLPSAKPPVKPSNANSPVEIGITVDGQYFFDADRTKFYSYEQLEPILNAKMEEQKEKNLKISGDRNTNYESVLQVIALAKSKEWKPVLTYKQD
ncbi:MAG: biopolymer transporter ExbD [Crocinitomicaceae bacterium]|nr:biopolymer transporter ExbD [Crocinitomicaceae bacterium]